MLEDCYKLLVEMKDSKDWVLSNETENRKLFKMQGSKMTSEFKNIPKFDEYKKSE